MPRRRVFVCYSRCDQELFEAFLTHLDPLKHHDLLSIWSDRELEPGEEWKPRVLRAMEEAEVAVVLVSPDLLASDFVREEELPRLLRAREHRGLVLLPLFLRPANADYLRFELDGGSLSLADIQGLNDPKEPLSNQASAARDATLQKASEQLLDAVKRLPENTLRRRTQRQLDIFLERRGNQVARRCGPPPYFELYSSRGELPLRELGGLAESVAKMADFGRLLFEVLVGTEKECQEALSRSLGREVSDPLRHAFRVRIRCDDLELLRLPWSLCRWRQHQLADEGWTFELAASHHPRPIEHLHTPFRATMITSELEGLRPLKAIPHRQSLQGLLRRAWKLPLKDSDSLLHRVSTKEALKKELARAPRLVYVYAHVRKGGADLEFLLEGTARNRNVLTLEELCGMLPQERPKVLVLHTVGEGPLASVTSGVSLFFHLQQTTPEPAGRQAILTWLNAVLAEEVDPWHAFCALPETIRRQSTLLTDFQEWRVDHSDYTPKVDRPRAHLDRRSQRGRVVEEVEQLVLGPKRRVTCLMAYGAEGNLVEHFMVQMLATLKDRLRRKARFVVHHLRLPEERENLGEDDILETLRDILGLQPSESLNFALRRTTHRGGPRSRPVHLLDWGTFGAGEHHQASLVSGHLETWVRFCRDQLEVACPSNMRILSYLSLESPQDRHAMLEQIVMDLKIRFQASHFDLVALPALGTVHTEDLLGFLQEEHNSSCPQDFLHNLPERIVRETGGSFEATVRLLEETERGNRWYELDEELPQAPPRQALQKDIPL